MGIVPAGKLQVRTGASSAPSADELIGLATGDPVRALAPSVAGALLKITASVRGFVDNPIHPTRGRDHLLATWDRGLDVTISNGTKLSAFDAYSGSFMIHVTPAVGSKEYSQHVALAPEGDEKNAVVQTNPHSPQAPVGFYNLPKATEAIDGIRRVLAGAVESPDTTEVNRLRATAILARVEQTQSYLGRLAESQATRPTLATLETAARLAHDVKRKGDSNDKQLTAVLAKLEAYVAKGADGLAPELLAQVKEDLQTIGADRAKWLNYHDDVSSYYLRR